MKSILLRSTLLAAGIVISIGWMAAIQVRIRRADKLFLVNAYSSSNLEIRAAQMALNVLDSDLLRFARRTIKIHSKLNEALVRESKYHKLILKTTLNKTDSVSFLALSSKHSTEFENTYAHAIVSGYKMALNLYRKEAGLTRDSALKSLADSASLVLTTQLEMAQGIQTHKHFSVSK